MKIFVCQSFHDYPCSVFADGDIALRHFRECRNGEYLDTMELQGDKFEQIGESLTHEQCGHCQKAWLSNEPRPCTNPEACDHAIEMEREAWKAEYALGLHPGCYATSTIAAPLVAIHYDEPK